MKKRKLNGFMAVITILAACAWATAGPAATVKLHTVTFQAPLPFSAPQEVGLDALIVLHPAKAALGTESVSIMAVRYSAEQKKQMEAGGTTLLDYTRSVFMGSAVKGTPVTRSFLGKSLAGQRFTKKIPRPATAEVYILPLKNGAFLALGFQWSAPVTDDTAKKLMDEIAATLKE